VIFPSEFLKSEKWKSLSSSARSTLLCLAVYADKVGFCYPSISTLAEDMRNDRKTIILAIKELINIHIVSKVQEAGKIAKYTINMSIEPVPKELPVVESVPVPNDTMTSTVLTTTPVPNQLPEHTINRVLTDHIEKSDSQKKTQEKKELIKKKVVSECLIEEIYSLYPTKDLSNHGRSTSKSFKDKEKIKKVIITGYPLKKAIEYYLGERKRTGMPLQDFKTFLNHLPDVNEINEVSKPETQRPKNWTAPTNRLKNDILDNVPIFKPTSAVMQ
jgi:hypothetical protein